MVNEREEKTGTTVSFKPDEDFDNTTRLEKEIDNTTELEQEAENLDIEEMKNDTVGTFWMRLYLMLLSCPGANIIRQKLKQQKKWK